MIDSLFAELFDSEIAVESAVPSADTPHAFPEEEALVARAVDKRVREVRASRHAVRIALARLGLPPVAVVHDADRAPIWPAGVVGTITHTKDLCAVAVARVGRIASIGLDVERTDPLSDPIVRRVCTDDEVLALARQGDVARLAKIVFSAKEAFYKAQYPLSRRFLGFHDVDVALDLTSGRFTVTLHADAHPLVRAQRIEGILRISATHVATAVTFLASSAGGAQL